MDKLISGSHTSTEEEQIHALLYLSKTYVERAVKIFDRANDISSAGGDGKKTLLKGYSEFVISSIKASLEALYLSQSSVLIDDKRKLDYEFVCYERLFFIKYRFTTDFNGMEECLVKASALVLLVLCTCFLFIDGHPKIQPFAANH